MALKKNNCRSIRFSDELLDIIEQQVGETFTAKFERLIYNCYMLQAQKESELQCLDDEIALKKDQLQKLRQDSYRLQSVVGSIQRQLNSVDRYLEDYIEDRL